MWEESNTECVIYKNVPSITWRQGDIETSGKVRYLKKKKMNVIVPNKKNTGSKPIVFIIIIIIFSLRCFLISIVISFFIHWVI